MIVSVFHFFKIQGKVAFGNSAVVVEAMLGKRPEPLDAVDVNQPLPTFPNEYLCVFDRIVLPVAFK